MIIWSWIEALNSMKQKNLQISQVGEFSLIRSFISQISKKKSNIRVGPGDDCAVVDFSVKTSLLCTTDMLIEGVHFRRDWMTPYEIGAKSMLVNLSDIAAMGGWPLYTLVSLGLPPRTSLFHVDQLFSGMNEVLEKAGGRIMGGDLNASREWIINITLMGQAPRGHVLTRGGARVGDIVYVTGTLGNSALGLQVLKKGKARGFEKFVQAHKVPPCRLDIAKWLVSKKFVHSMIDLSDGLIGDLRHVLEASNAGAEIWRENIPFSSHFFDRSKALRVDPWKLILSGGEDYELLFTASPEHPLPARIRGVPVTPIGVIRPPRFGLCFLDASGQKCDMNYLGLGFEHFD